MRESDDTDDHDNIDDADQPVPSVARLHVRGGGFGLSPLGTSTDRRCSFCNRRKESVSRLVRGRGGALICDRCVELAGAAIKTDTSTDQILRIRPARSAPTNRDDAEAAIERAYETVLGGADSHRARCAAIEAGDDLMGVMREVDVRYPTRGQIDVSVDYIRFIDDREAEVGYTLLFGANAMFGMSKGDAVEEGGTWKMSRSTYAELVGRIGVALLPRPGETP